MGRMMLILICVLVALSVGCSGGFVLGACWEYVRTHPDERAFEETFGTEAPSWLD